MSDTGERIEVTAAVIAAGRRILACRRPRNARHHPGQWEFAGGKREPGESLEECLQRELLEELGIAARIGAKLARHAYDYPGGPRVDVHFYFVREFAPQPVNRCFDEIRWVPAGSLGRLDFLAADREVVAALDAGRIALPEVRSPAAS